MSRKILEELLEKEHQDLNKFFDSLDLDTVYQALQLLANCEGMIVLTGIGKSGLVAKKIAVTMTSTGTRALFLSPTNALHGDIGILNPKDVFLVLSKSGESDELLNLIPFIRNRGVKVIGMVSNPESRLANAVDLALNLPSLPELCPYDMAPTTSTTIQSIVGDILSVALMRLKEFSLEEYAKTHPAGRIGKRMIVKVSDLMLKGEDIPVCKPQDKLVDSLVILSNKQCGCILIVDESNKLKGIFTDGDLRRALQQKGGDALHSSMESLMTKSPRSINPNELAWAAMKQMESKQKQPITVLPVLDNQTIVGIIKMHDIIQAGI